MDESSGATVYFYTMGQLCQTWFPTQSDALNWLRKAYLAGRLSPRDLRDRDGKTIMDTVEILTLLQGGGPGP